MNLETILFSDISLTLTAIAAGFLAALWLSLAVWTFRDIRRRARDPFTRILAVLLVLLLFLPGLLLYLILRPSITLEEEYQHTLEEEALLQNIEDTPLCPGCNRRIQPDWMVCPSCHTLLKKRCPNCSKLMELPWNLCPYCATALPGVRLENETHENGLTDLPDESPAVNENETGETERYAAAESDDDWILIPRAGNEDPQPETPPPGG
ncbi:MAG: zinc ribbon domain-containing protein [Chloroflexi bacterium]|nr:MAG: zinc ribbon domain-containing protein [Chloroflexota bacterium]